MSRDEALEEEGEQVSKHVKSFVLFYSHFLLSSHEKSFYDGQHKIGKEEENLVEIIPLRNHVLS